jgi:predicted nucleic acid-binding protein
VRRWVADPPSWLEIVAPKQAPDSELFKTDLDPGERDAILLAQELAADELIIDDMGGRREAQRRRLHFIGTVGVLQTAAEMGLLDFREALARLRGTNFCIAQEILDRLIGYEGT